MSERLERKQEQIEKYLINYDAYPEKVRKKPLLTPEELDRFPDNYLQKQQSEKADRIFQNNFYHIFGNKQSVLPKM